MLKAFPIVLALAILCAAMAREVKAWGFELHELIARQAQAMLSQQAKTMLESLLAQEEGASLPTISTWADKHREFPTATWHYVNFPKGQCQYEQARDCPEGHCVIEAFAQQLKLLQTSKDPAEQLRALKFVVHLTSDVHQPLHAAWGEDRGGNRFQLQAFGRGSNLHAFWDSTLARQAEGGLEGLESDVKLQMARLDTLRPERMGEGRNPMEPWALESCRIVAEDGFYPSSREVDQAYVQKHRPTLVRRLAQASRRLAETLNRVAAAR